MRGSEVELDLRSRNRFAPSRAVWILTPFRACFFSRRVGLTSIELANSNIFAHRAQNFGFETQVQISAPLSMLETRSLPPRTSA